MKNLSVTVLDDDDFILDVAQTMIESLGVGDITTYVSAKQALTELNISDSQQILLCDLNMPEMDGVEVIRYLGQCHFAGAIIVLSGEDTRTLQTVVNMGRAYHLRLLGSLTKPLDLQELQRLFHLCLTSISKSRYGLMELTASEIESGMAEALLPYFQPQVDVRSRKVVGVEALARWQLPNGEVLGPAAFIAQAEASGLIQPLTDLMLTKSLQQWQVWNEAGIDVSISVNISMHSLNCIDFPDQLMIEMQALGVPLDRLILEITESQLAQDMRVAADVLTRLCLKRIRLSVDDFGTAYSNMEKLLMVPFSELKIDRAFVHDSVKNASAYAILKSSIDLGHKLGMTLVAEGVENQDDWDCVSELGCDLVQGYFVARPMPGNQLPIWLQNWR